jgi:F-type H+-transporting ATPase subunit gamma
MSLKAVKTKIRSVHKVHQVTKAMEAVSAVKMRRSQEQALSARPFALHALGMLHRIIAKGVGHDHPLVVPHTNTQPHVCYVVVTADRGLAGALNSRVIVQVYKHMEQLGLQKSDVSIVAVGKRGYEHFSRREFHVRSHVERWGEGVSFGDPDTLAHELMKLLMKKEVDEVLEELLPYLVAAFLYHSVLEANASEHSARMVAMKSASDRARDVGKSLKRVYNKERQAAITAEVSEITSGIEAMK